MGSLTPITAGLVERYCDECVNFNGACGGGQKGECFSLNKLMEELGCPTRPVVYGNSRADSCKYFSPHDFSEYVKRAVEAGNFLDGAA